MRAHEKYTGIIKFINTVKGFGFITESISKEDIFFFINNIDTEAEIKVGQKVNFIAFEGKKGLMAMGSTRYSALTWAHYEIEGWYKVHALNDHFYVVINEREEVDHLAIRPQFTDRPRVCLNTWILNDPTVCKETVIFKGEEYRLKYDRLEGYQFIDKTLAVEIAEEEAEEKERAEREVARKAKEAAEKEERRKEILEAFKTGKEILVWYNPDHYSYEQRSFLIPLNDYIIGIGNIPEYNFIEEDYEIILLYKGEENNERIDLPKENIFEIDDYEYDEIKSYL